MSTTHRIDPSSTVGQDLHRARYKAYQEHREQTITALEEALAEAGYVPAASRSEVHRALGSHRTPTAEFSIYLSKCRGEWSHRPLEGEAKTEQAARDVNHLFGPRRAE
jgi:hypothetical protein